MKVERRHIPLLIVLGTALVVCLLHYLANHTDRFDFFRRLEWITYDWRMREAVRREPARVSGKLGFVYINDETIALLGAGELGTNLHVGLYWPRHVYGRLVRELKNQGARAVGLDILFDQLRPFDKPVPVGGEWMESDTFFRREMRQAGNVVLGTADVAPHPKFRDAAAAIADIATIRDADGVLRRARAFRDYRLWHPEILTSGECRLKFMRQINIGFRSKNLLNLPQRILTCGACYREKHRARQSNRDDCAALMNKHFVLLNHGVAISEQVRISLNKFRLFQGTRCCRCRFPVLSTIRPVSVDIQTPRSK